MCRGLHCYGVHHHNDLNCGLHSHEACGHRIYAEASTTTRPVATTSYTTISTDIPSATTTIYVTTPLAINYNNAVTCTTATTYAVTSRPKISGATPTYTATSTNKIYCHNDLHCCLGGYKAHSHSSLYYDFCHHEVCGYSDLHRGLYHLCLCPQQPVSLCQGP